MAQGADPQFEFDAIFTDQVEEHNRDWAREHGRYVFDSYAHTGAYAELLAMLLASREEPRFEFTVKGVIGDRALFLGKPDCRFVHECGGAPDRCHLRRPRQAKSVYRT